MLHQYNITPRYVRLEPGCGITVYGKILNKDDNPISTSLKYANDTTKPKVIELPKDYNMVFFRLYSIESNKAIKEELYNYICVANVAENPAICMGHLITQHIYIHLKVFHPF